MRDAPIPFESPGWLGLRHTRAFLRDPLDFITRAVRAQGDVSRLYMLGQSVYLLSHPDDIESLLVEHQDDVIKDLDTRRLGAFVLGQGLLSSEGAPWRKQRKLMASAFTPRRIRSYAAAMDALARRNLARWHHGMDMDLHAEMSRITLHIVAAVLFGADVEADTARVAAAMAVLDRFFSHSIEQLLRVPRWVPTPSTLRVRRAVRDIDEVMYRIIGERRGRGLDGTPAAAAPGGHGEGAGDRSDERAGQRAGQRAGERAGESSGRGAGGAGDDVLGALLAARDDAGTGMTDQQLRDECVTLFLAGHETTALALVHALYLLARHPEIEARFHEEVAAVLGPPGHGDPDLAASDAVARLDLTRRILEEAMRLYPPAWAIGREVRRPFTLRDHHFDVGTQLVISQWVLHRDPRWFPEPERFDPDRWLPERASRIPRMAFLPFGGGPRICIGNHFAMTESVLVLARIGQRFRVEVRPGTELAFRPSVTLRPRDGGLRGRVVARMA
jgi:cytochrome P450